MAEKKQNYRREVAEAIKRAAGGVVTVRDDATNPYAFVVEITAEDGSSKKFRVITKELD